MKKKKRPWIWKRAGAVYGTVGKEERKGQEMKFYYNLREERNGKNMHNRSSQWAQQFWLWVRCKSKVRRDSLLLQQCPGCFWTSRAASGSRHHDILLYHVPFHKVSLRLALHSLMACAPLSFTSCLQWILTSILPQQCPPSLFTPPHHHFSKSITTLTIPQH